MSKKIQLSIPTPCHENWDNMTPVEKGRFCGSCQKQVVDFSRMSDREIAMFFKKPILSQSKDGSVCGRFMEDQLDRDIEIPKKRIPWVKYFFQFALPAFLVSAKATAQGKVGKKDSIETCSQIRVMGTMTPFAITDRNLRGRVVDENGLQIPKASLKVVQTGFTVIADSLGRFTLEAKNLAEKFQIEISSIGYGTKKIDYLLEPNKFSNYITIVLEQKAMKLDEVVIVSPVATRKGRITAGAVCFKKTVYERAKDSVVSVLNLFRIYPNPIQAGTLLNIEWKQSESGDHILQLFNQAGQLTFSKQLWIDDEARVLNLEVPHVAAGSYFLRMTNKNSGKAFTEKIIIQ